MIRLGIVGYGNLARGAECAIAQNADMALAAVFTRRAPDTVKILTPEIPVLPMAELEKWQEKLDVLLLCGGSATDLPVQTPKYAALRSTLGSTFKQEASGSDKRYSFRLFSVYA